MRNLGRSFRSRPAGQLPRQDLLITQPNGPKQQPVCAWLSTKPDLPNEVSQRAIDSGRKTKKPDKFAERDFFLSVLSASTTKREAKSYLSRFKKHAASDASATSVAGHEQPRVARQVHQVDPGLSKTGVNLGNLYTSATAIKQSPVFTQQPLRLVFTPSQEGLTHVAIVLIRSPQLLDDNTLSGVGLTLAQLARLGLHSVVVVDHDGQCSSKDLDTSNQAWKAVVSAQADRIVSAIQRHNSAGARHLNDVIGVTSPHDEAPSTVHVWGSVRVQYEELLFRPLERNITPVISTVAYDTETQQLRRSDAEGVVMALTREFAGIASQPDVKEQDLVASSHAWTSEPRSTVQRQTSLDRVIVLDPMGGIPSPDRGDGAHVFINLEQEYEDIREELSGKKKHSNFLKSDKRRTVNMEPVNKSEGVSTSFSGRHAGFDNAQTQAEATAEKTHSSSAARALKNLDLIQKALALLPPSSSALITTAAEAARSAMPVAVPNRTPDVRTRLSKNLLIHNLLTDKPIVSSSLPSERLSSSSARGKYEAPQPTPATFVKRGMPLTMVPDPRKRPWAPPGPNNPPILLTEPPVDLPRLLDLIEDSFNRPLDVRHYLDRIHNRMAGIIIVGKYEGGAVLTWETPPGAPSDTPVSSLPRPPIPYLDKFAVLKRSQGAGGVADTVFTAMVRTCFPKGVVWRSRASNPVNKWYFERAVGSWKLPGTQWTMFWTTPGVEADEDMWKDYVNVCRGVQPSWADRKHIAD